MKQELSIVELLNDCRRGDETARGRLFSLYHGYLLTLARVQIGAHLRGKCDASDIVQMTLLEAHRDFSAFAGQSEAELLGWLRKILAHNLFNETRKHQADCRDVSRELSMDQMRAGVDRSSLLLVNTIADNAASPSSMAGHREIAVKLADALGRLPEDYQTVLMLRILQELPAEEVGTRMGKSAGAVRMLQMRALVALRAEMGLVSA
jgi:RNA polymerase sigma-70 factor (ECF subfamily)